MFLFKSTPRRTGSGEPLPAQTTGALPGAEGQATTGRRFHPVDDGELEPNAPVARCAGECEAGRVHPMASRKGFRLLWRWRSITNGNTVNRVLPESAGPGGAPGSSEQGNFAFARAIVEHWTSQARQAMVVRFLVPLCPSESLISVAAIHCLVASCPEKGQARPRWRDCEAIANRAEPGKSKSKESMPWRNAKSPPSSGCRTGG